MRQRGMFSVDRNEVQTKYPAAWQRCKNEALLLVAGYLTACRV